jgi:hypothetical protein
MTIKNFDDFELYKKLYPLDNNKRQINIYKAINLTPINDTFYPNCYFYSGNTIINPMREKTMSLSDIDFKPTNTEVSKGLSVYKNPVFYFVYNTDNYYHFIYDTLPYLISFFNRKKEIPNLKLFMNYPNRSKLEFYRFVEEFLDILEIKKEDITIISTDLIYEEVYFSNSYI